MDRPAGEWTGEIAVLGGDFASCHAARHLVRQGVKVHIITPFAAVADEKLGVTRDGALMHAKDAELADEGIDDDLEDVREHVLPWVRLGMEFAGVLALAFEKERRISFGRIGRELHQHIEELCNARAGARGDETHGHQMTFAKRLLERCVELVGRDLALLQIE